MGRGDSWGFPRWRPYGGASSATTVRMCERAGCDQPGDCPAPKAANRPEKWHFCQRHAAEYNAGWNYFDALSDADAAAQAAGEERDAGAYRSASHWGWGEGDGSRSRAEMDALGLLGLAVDATPDDIKSAHRAMAKANHPDLNPGDAGAAQRFHAAQAAYEVLVAAEARRAAVAKAGA